MGNSAKQNLSVLPALDDMDPRSGNPLERVVFNNRRLFLVIAAIVTLILAFQVVTKLELKPSFEKMIPQSHPYIRNYLDNRDALRGLGNSVRVVVENTKGDIFDPGYLDVLQDVNDQLIVTGGVDRAWVKSLWTPNVRWTEVTEDGFQGGPVMPDNYDGSDESIRQLRQNISRAGIVGSLVSTDFRSSMIVVPILDRDSATGAGIDYVEFSDAVEELRDRYGVSNDGDQEQGDSASPYRIRVIGFAKLVGDMINGLVKVGMFFALAVAIAVVLIFLYTRCVRSTLLVVSCSLLAVIWQLGIVTWLGFALDPYSILVPFLVFAIGVSHATQKMNGIMQDIGRGAHKLVAARYTFRRLFLAGVTALLSDAVGFAVLMFIDIPIIRELAITASIGVAMLIFTTLLLMPVALSFTGVNVKAAERSVREFKEAGQHRGVGKLWGALDRLTQRRWAVSALIVASLMGGSGYLVGLQLKVGDLDAGAPELRPDSRYNLDNAYITRNYGLSSDVFAVMVKTEPEGCLDYRTLIQADRLAWKLKQHPGVQTTVSLPDAMRQITAGTYEGNPKFASISRNQYVLNYGAQQASVNRPELFNTECSVMPVIAFLEDHKAETLDSVVSIAEKFADENSNDERAFLLAAGNAGIEAATNLVVRDAHQTMLFYVYLAVGVFCLIAFRSWRATLVAILPLVLTSVLCEALMVWMGIGVKVATLPVIALGVGIGVDYALYLLSAQLDFQRRGESLAAAYEHALNSTGKVVALVGLTLATSVLTWVWSPIKFQADMGVLLMFMFLWNMLGALLLIPALSHFLLPTVYSKQKVEQCYEDRIARAA